MPPHPAPPIQRLVLCSLRLAAFIASLAIAGTASASPLPTRDQNPLLAGFGIPMAMPSSFDTDGGDWHVDTALNWGNTSIVQAEGDEALIVDAETRELRLTIGRAVSERWGLQLQVPYRYTGGGNLDGFIDGWHDFFGLPEGARPVLPRNQFTIDYTRGGLITLADQPSREGLGDVSLDLGYQWLSTPHASVAAWLSVKLPTGDSEDFNGSGATDLSLTLAGERRFGDTWSAFGQLSATALGEGDLLPDQQRDFVVSAMAGIGVNVWRGLDLKLQFDAHTAAFDDTALDYLDDTVILTVGGAWKSASGWVFDFGVSEDIIVEGSPDVVFVFGVSRRASPSPSP